LQLLRSRVTSRVESDGAAQFSTITEAWADVAISRSVAPAAAVRRHRRRKASQLQSDRRERARADLAAARRARRRALWTIAHGAESRDSLFVGQQVDYRVDVLLNETARYAAAAQPDVLSARDVGRAGLRRRHPARMPRQGRRCFETLSYRRGLFPLFPGNVTIPPAVLTYSLPLTSSFFSREESFELRSDSVRFVAVDPPARDRPWTTPVRWDAARQPLAPRPVRRASAIPVVLTVRVTAAGNVKLLPRPSLELPWATITPGDERVEIDSTATRISGSKEFEWLITPREAGTQVVPSIRYPYFDPVIPSLCGDRDRSDSRSLWVRRRSRRATRCRDASADPRRVAAGAAGASHGAARSSGHFRARPASRRAPSRRAPSPARHQRIERGAPQCARSPPRARPCRRASFDGLSRCVAGARARTPDQGSRTPSRERCAGRRERRRRASRRKSMLARLDDAAFSATGALDDARAARVSGDRRVGRRGGDPPVARSSAHVRRADPRACRRGTGRTRLRAKSNDCSTTACAHTSAASSASRSAVSFA
jgi:hypothetical protein